MGIRRWWNGVVGRALALRFIKRMDNLTPEQQREMDGALRSVLADLDSGREGADAERRVQEMQIKLLREFESGRRDG